MLRMFRKKAALNNTFVSIMNLRRPQSFNKLNVHSIFRMKGRRSLLFYLRGTGRLEILEHLLARRGPCTINSISRDTGIALSTTWVALRDLCDLGLVRAERLGRDSLVEVNRASPIVERVKELLSVDLQTPHMAAFEDFSRRVRARLPKVRVDLFGSVAKGTERASSDVDVMVVYGGTPYGREKVGTVSDQAALKTFGTFRVALTAIVVEKPLE